MFFKALFGVSKQDREDIIQRLIDNSYPGYLFFVMMGLAVLIAAIGIVIDNIAVIIGSMLVAPFLIPFLSLAMGIVLADQKLIQRSAGIVVKIILISLALSIIVSIFVRPSEGLNASILALGEVGPPLLYVAILSGLAASVAVVHPKFIEHMVGAAVSVALLPPLANVGIGIGALRFDIAIGALELFFVNLLGVVLAGVVVFSLVGFYRERRVAEVELKAEEKKLEKEKEKPEPKPNPKSK